MHRLGLIKLIIMLDKMKILNYILGIIKIFA